MFEQEELIPLPEDVFRLLRDLISDFCGLYFDESSKYIIERRLNRRLKLHMFDNFRDYYRFLLYDKRKDEELSAIVDILTVNETYFFREMNQLKAFSEEICQEMLSLRKNEKKFRIWSAGCSSGEEPYTLAMLLLEKGDMFRGFDIEILGSDINRRVLQTARKGVYRKNSFRATDEYYIKKYFEPEGDGYKIKDNVKELVNFSYMNLLDPIKIKLIGMMDVILCRNVIIYFHPESKKKLIFNFYQRLNDGGYLLLGHAESLINISTQFTLKHLKSDMVYQKPKKFTPSMSDENLFKMLWKR
jgi:chemotaxis protein methyltransferase CheR